MSNRESVRRSRLLISHDSQRRDLARINIHAILTWTEEYAATELESGFSLEAARELVAKILTASQDARELMAEMEAGPISCT